MTDSSVDIGTVWGLIEWSIEVWEFVSLGSCRSAHYTEALDTLERRLS